MLGERRPKLFATPFPVLSLSASPQPSEGEQATLTSSGIVLGLFLLVLTAVLISAPFVLSFLKIGEKTLFGCFAADSMYYLAIAKNTVLYGFFTFNRETVTNGFQPLWQYILVLFQWVVKPSLENQLLLAFVVNLLLVILGFAAALWGVLSYFGLRIASLMPFLMLPGAFALFFEPSLGHYSPDSALLYSFSSWAFVNGMESGVSIAAFGLFLMTVLMRLSRADKHTMSLEIFSFWPSIWLSAIVLARLDDALLVPPIALTILLFDHEDIFRRIRKVAQVLLPVGVFVLLYMAYNMVTVGVALPLSGLQKTGFALAGNFKNALSLFSDYQPEIASRMLPMLVFMLSGAIMFPYALLQFGRVLNEEDWQERIFKKYLVVPLSGYLFLKAAFHFSMVGMWGQGWWYYSGQIFIFNFLLSVVLGCVLASRNVLYTVSLLFAFLVTMVQAVDTGHRIGKLEGYAESSFRLWKQSRSLNTNLQAIDRDMKLIDNADGLYGFILDMPVASGNGSVFSVEEMREAGKKGKVDALIERGYTVLPVLDDPASWQGHYLRLKKLDVRADPIYVDEGTRVTFYRLSRRAS